MALLAVAAIMDERPAGIDLALTDVPTLVAVAANRRRSTIINLAHFVVLSERRVRALAIADCNAPASYVTCGLPQNSDRFTGSVAATTRLPAAGEGGVEQWESALVEDHGMSL